jgi:hypothetical protein
MAQGAGVNSTPFANSVGTYGQVSRTLETSDLLFCIIYLHCKFYNVIKINCGPDWWCSLDGVGPRAVVWRPQG